MTKLQELLKELGLEQYARVLAENDIEFDILSDLSESDLEKLGLSLGHRRKLLKALAALKPAPSQPEASPTTSEAKEAERRQVTVLFSDLVGSTALANAIDPEEMSVLIRRYQDACAGAIARFDGFIAKFMGDGVLAYFGYPQAQEDAAERSVYAALAIIDSVTQLKGPEGQALKTRVGIATGIVVIGDIVGSGVAREGNSITKTLVNKPSRDLKIRSKSGACYARQRSRAASRPDMPPEPAHSLAACRKWDSSSSGGNW
jgi:Adenylate and Guanylate cyclase catalytic domain/SAM domain (Sterile alpha motif)